MDEALAIREMISRILSLPPGDVGIVTTKIEICRKYRLSSVPRTQQSLLQLTAAEREDLRRVLLVKPTRTLSGVAPVRS